MAADAALTSYGLVIDPIDRRAGSVILRHRIVDAMPTKKEKPYVPKYKGFDEEATERAHKTAERAQKGAGAKGEDANKEYVDEGPAEYKRRTE